MPPVESPLFVKSVHGLTPEDVNRIKKKVTPYFEELGLEIHPFKVEWYNQYVPHDYKLNYDKDTLVFLVISMPSMFEKAFFRYLKEELNLLDSNLTEYFDPIDKCIQYYFGLLKQKLESLTKTDIDTLHDFDLNMPSRKPKILLQTAAHVAGAAFYYKLLNKNKHRLGVCIHPRFGGWFGIRGAFIFRELRVPHLILALPIDIVPKDKQLILLEMFNERWQDWSYRDIIDVQYKYSQLQIEYFTLKPRDRIQFLKSKVLPHLREQSSPTHSPKNNF